MSCCFDACISFLRLRGEPPSLAKNSVVPEGRMGASPGAYDSLCDIPVFFRAPPGGAGNFLLRGQEKVTKEKATPVLRFSSIRGRKIRSGRPGLPTRHPWRGGKRAQSLAPTLRAFSSDPHRSTGAPQKLCFDAGHPWPPSEQDPFACFASTCAQVARHSGPLEHGEWKKDMDVVWKASKDVRKGRKNVAAPECTHTIRKMVAS